MRHPPERVKTTEVVEWNEGHERRVLDDLAAEEPLEIRVGGEVLTITMRTPGDDFELAAGFLHAEHFRLEPELLTCLPAVLRSAQRVFGRTGGLHAAGLFDANGRLLLVREDIGRHNAVDKAVGDSLLRGSLPLSEGLLLVSGRGGFEIVQKALVAGIPILASVSAPSSLAVQMARAGGLTLVGFLRDRRFVLYSHPNRVAIRRDSYSTSSPVP
jgi:FdhD protein